METRQYQNDETDEKNYLFDTSNLRKVELRKKVKIIDYRQKAHELSQSAAEFHEDKTDSSNSKKALARYRYAITQLTKVENKNDQDYYELVLYHYKAAACAPLHKKYQYIKKAIELLDRVVDRNDAYYLKLSLYYRHAVDTCQDEGEKVKSINAAIAQLGKVSQLGRDSDYYWQFANCHSTASNYSSKETDKLNHLTIAKESMDHVSKRDSDFYRELAYVFYKIAYYCGDKDVLPHLDRSIELNLKIEDMRDTDHFNLHYCYLEKIPCLDGKISKEKSYLAANEALLNIPVERRGDSFYELMAKCHLSLAELKVSVSKAHAAYAEAIYNLQKIETKTAAHVQLMKQICFGLKNLYVPDSDAHDIFNMIAQLLDSQKLNKLNKGVSHLNQSLYDFSSANTFQFASASKPILQLLLFIRDAYHAQCLGEFPLGLRLKKPYHLALFNSFIDKMTENNPEKRVEGLEKEMAKLKKENQQLKDGSRREWSLFKVQEKKAACTGSEQTNPLRRTW
jgi:hypothetical protein